MKRNKFQISIQYFLIYFFLLIFLISCGPTKKERGEFLYYTMHDEIYVKIVQEKLEKQNDLLELAFAIDYYLKKKDTIDGLYMEKWRDLKIPEVGMFFGVRDTLSMKMILLIKAIKEANHNSATFYKGLNYERIESDFNKYYSSLKEAKTEL